MWIFVVQRSCHIADVVDPDRSGGTGGRVCDLAGGLMGGICPAAQGFNVSTEYANIIELWFDSVCVCGH